MDNKKRIHEFASLFAKKYKFDSLSPIGAGAHAEVFKAKDLYREVDVAIKLYHDGTVPLGSERGWIITSKIINRQIASTFTIETFTGSDGKEYQAVVSRFIPGKSMDDIIVWYNNQKPEDRKIITDDLVHTLLPSLLSILELCHSLGYGHGDLHGSNVIVSKSEIRGRFEFNPVLIDFDNASIQTELASETEKEKVEKDCRTIGNRSIGVGRWLLLEWEWYSEIEDVFDVYSTVREYRIAFKHILQFADLLKDGTPTKEKIDEILFSLASYMFTFSHHHAVVCIQRIADKAGIGNLFKSCYENVLTRIRDGSALHAEVEIVTDGHIKKQLYKTLFP